MTNEEFENLREGDIVQNQGTGQAYTVIMRYADRVMAMRTVDITNLSEWEIVQTVIKRSRVKKLSELNCDISSCEDVGTWIHAMYPGKIFCGHHKSLLATIFNNDMVFGVCRMSRYIKKLLAGK